MTTRESEAPQAPKSKAASTDTDPATLHLATGSGKSNAAAQSLERMLKEKTRNAYKEV